MKICILYNIRQKRKSWVWQLTITFIHYISCVARGRFFLPLNSLKRLTEELTVSNIGININQFGKGYNRG